MAATEKNPHELAKAKELNHIPWCEEYEKMISGMLYASFSADLEAARFKARAWAHEYNHYFPDSTTNPTFETLAAERLFRLRTILGHVGNDIFIEPPFHIDYGCNISLGDRFYANFNLTILDCSLVTIGDRCMFGPNVSIFAATHETEVQSRRENVEYGLPVEIGDDCWIGGHVVILPGVKIGKGVTVAASSVVTKDVEDWCVVMGSPARVVKRVDPVPDVVEEK
ncbi:trimeric LpxA-like protein [Lentithecium fluviatile CBS 122367]|uniref:Trimeric LpxA-like protein n=1 Tax=Lentithecium fluviatile CBS 122367 TaxID=1168545 RepID=A0A6G1JMC1_9PLEO|nr:trimeric LpxA-like protein [Lentithecium fluviatile CBS 122367]